VYYFKDKRYWVGNFVDNRKERTSVLVYPDLKIEIVPFLNNCFCGNKKIVMKLISRFIENNKSIEDKIEKVKEITKINDMLISRNTELIEEKKKAAEENFEYVEDMEEKKKLLRLKKIKGKTVFMFDFIMKQKKDWSNQ
jgi:hypothetical protein